MSKIDNFPYPTPTPAKIWGCSLWSRSVMLGSAGSEMVSLISREIISQNSNLYDHDTILQRHRQTDGQLALQWHVCSWVVRLGEPLIKLQAAGRQAKTHNVAPAALKHIANAPASALHCGRGHRHVTGTEKRWDHCLRHPCYVLSTSACSTLEMFYVMRRCKHSRFSYLVTLS